MKCNVSSLRVCHMTTCLFIAAYRMSQPGVTGVLCADDQGLALSGETSTDNRDTYSAH